MTKEEVNKILYEISYNDYVNQLKEKYGNVPKDYFYVATKGKTQGELAKTPGITRGKEGLYIHHVYECYYLNLGDPFMYNLQLAPSKLLDDKKIEDAQKAENLVYCNLLEHLILHIKIALEYHRGAEHVGISFITGDLNRLYDLGDKNLIESTYNTPNQIWKRAVYNNIKNDYNIYVILGKVIVNKLYINKELICNVKFYDYTYQKLYRDIGKVDKNVIIKQIQLLNENGYSDLFIKNCSNTDDLDILYELLNSNSNIKYPIYIINTIINKILKLDKSNNSIKIIEKFINTYSLNDSIKETILKNENCPISVLKNLSKDKLASIRVLVVKNKNVTSTIIDSMRNDTSKMVIKAIEVRDKKLKEKHK